MVVEHPAVVAGYRSRYPYARSGRMPLADDCAVPDPLDLLSFLAACTDRIQLATGVLVLPVHHPVVLAKRVATVDALSGGRVRLCVGGGWMAEELLACGVDPATRGGRMDEAIDVLRLLWADDDDAGVSFDGEFVSFSGVRSYPKPARPGGVPVHVGGHSAAAAARAGRRGEGFQPLGLDPEGVRVRMDQARAAAAGAGRDPAALELTLGGHLPAVTEDTVGDAADLGASRMVLSTAEPRIEAVCDQLSAFAARFALATADGGA